MATYKVRSGQNIYDIALSLYGSLEGVFYLLAANKWLTLETFLKCGMEIEYSEELVINNDIPIWFKDNSIKVKNGEHVLKFLDIEKLAQDHVNEEHPDIDGSLQDMSPDERTMYWELLINPRMVIQQQGQLSAITLRLIQSTHMIIDWGDYSDPQIIEGEEEKVIEHYYKGSGKHIITLYGDFVCSLLDLTEVNGIHYPLGIIYVDEFKNKVKLNDLNKLIIPTK